MMVCCAASAWSFELPLNFESSLLVLEFEVTYLLCFYVRFPLYGFNKVDMCTRCLHIQLKADASRVSYTHVSRSTGSHRSRSQQYYKNDLLRIRHAAAAYAIAHGESSAISKKGKYSFDFSVTIFG